MAEGIFGQYIYINPAAHLVIVQWSAWPGAWVDANAEEAAAFYGGVVKALKSSRPHLDVRSAS
jgi:CubicO group peptidase (beta-lactamase class C family)